MIGVWIADQLHFMCMVADNLLSSFLVTGEYMVIKSADPKLNPGDKAWLESPTYSNPSKESYCVRFWYYMDGSDMGTLNVYTNIDNAGYTNAFTAKGEIYIILYVLCIYDICYL